MMSNKASRIKSINTRISKKDSSWIKKIFNYRCYITFLTGCYSCHWKFRQWEETKLGSCCCPRKEQVFFVFLVISFILSVILLFMWIEMSNEYFGFDWVLFLETGFWVFGSIIFLSILGTLTAYTTLLLIVGVLLLRERIELYLHKCHKVLIVLVILFYIFFMFMLFVYWNDKWLTFGLSLQIFSPYIHLCSITVMVLLSWPLTCYIARLEREVRVRRYKMAYNDKERLKKCNIFTRLRALQLATGLPFLLILICLYLMPLGIYSPCIQKKEDLAPKPVFFAHRGAPMHGPENTMMAFEKAVEFGAYGLETDVHISIDHVPFLMHDYDLRRTTNIREVLPEAAMEHPSLFNWTFLSTLNAGKWFLQSGRKPFYNMKPLSEADKKRARNQSIPKLDDLLELAKKANVFLIFDLYGPSATHSLRTSFVKHVTDLILDSNIEPHLIYWLSTHDRQYVRKKAPGFQMVGRLYTTKELKKENISTINVDYKNLFYRGFRDYKAANININLYLVNEPWLFSLAWCSRIDSVTTDNIPLLSQLDSPHFFMTPRYYIFMWFLMDIISATFIIAIFCFQWHREMKKEKLNESVSTQTDMLETAPTMEKESQKTFGLGAPFSHLEELSDIRSHSISKQSPKRRPANLQDTPKRKLFLTGTAKKINKPLGLLQGNVRPPLLPKENINLPRLSKKDITASMAAKRVVKPPGSPKGNVRPPDTSQQIELSLNQIDPPHCDVPGIPRGSHDE
ncbi:glycerophosphodiester phosphodiesterase domain-containing protein 4 isoform X2 [Ochotona princeps]|uniref:glycerophosphodiester phosphodiesterase domain-containing protein 4 isoform X2 n=1 Tax=Ochotona princeps TaxID=9978 RepID=UPI0027151939|nr:glycerophosphodiester phosphodiesterase domain-containing protein 4 isoform X2 [Ochotona princeps]